VALVELTSFHVEFSLVLLFGLLPLIEVTGF